MEPHLRPAQLSTARVRPSPLALRTGVGLLIRAIASRPAHAPGGPWGATVSPAALDRMQVCELLAKLPARPVFCLVQADFVVEDLGPGTTPWYLVIVET